VPLSYESSKADDDDDTKTKAVGGDKQHHIVGLALGVFGVCRTSDTSMRALMRGKFGLSAVFLSEEAILSFSSHWYRHVYSMRKKLILPLDLVRFIH
jgi:hypothetical protein